MAKIHNNPGHGAHGAGAHNGHDHGRGHIGKPTYYKVFIALMVLMGLTVGAYYLEAAVAMPRTLGVLIAMAIAITKTALIVIFFMHVKVSERVTQLYAAAAFVTFALMVIIMMGDYFARGWPPQIGPLT